MTHVVTLIGRPGEQRVNEALVDRIRALLSASKPAAWLSAGEAVDIPFSLPDRQPSILADELRGVVHAPVDVVVQPLANRRKKLLVADMDSTMIQQECIDELADFVGLKQQVAQITERAMQGDIAFEPALRERVALLRGLSSDVIGRVLEERISLMPGARTLIATMRAAGAYTCLVSGGFTAFTDAIAARIGFDESRGNILDVDEAGRLTGTVRDPILGRQGKLQALRELTEQKGLQPDDTLAVGDGANDLEMIAAAGLGVAFHAKPPVAEAAHARIDHGDLTALLYLQGYRRDEFVAAD